MSSSTSFRASPVVAYRLIQPNAPPTTATSTSNSTSTSSATLPSTSSLSHNTSASLPPFSFRRLLYVLFFLTAVFSPFLLFWSGIDECVINRYPTVAEDKLLLEQKLKELQAKRQPAFFFENQMFHVIVILVVAVIMLALQAWKLTHPEVIKRRNSFPNLIKHTQTITQSPHLHERTLAARSKASHETADLSPTSLTASALAANNNNNNHNNNNETSSLSSLPPTVSHVSHFSFDPKHTTTSSGSNTPETSLTPTTSNGSDGSPTLTPMSPMESDITNNLMSNKQQQPLPPTSPTNAVVLTEEIATMLKWWDITKIVYSYLFYLASYFLVSYLKALIGDRTCNKHTNSVSGHYVFFIYTSILLVYLHFSYNHLHHLHIFSKKFWSRLFAFRTNPLSVLVWLVVSTYILISMSILHDTYFHGFHSLRQIVYGVWLAFIMVFVVTEVLNTVEVRLKQYRRRAKKILFQQLQPKKSNNNAHDSEVNHHAHLNTFDLHLHPHNPCNTTHSQISSRTTHHAQSNSNLSKLDCTSDDDRRSHTTTGLNHVAIQIDESDMEYEMHNASTSHGWLHQLFKPIAEKEEKRGTFYRFPLFLLLAFQVFVFVLIFTAPSSISKSIRVFTVDIVALVLGYSFLIFVHSTKLCKSII